MMRTEEKAMIEFKMDTENLDVDELSFECSDETVETAAGATRYVAAALTLSFCSGLDSCPA